jgi:nicotinate-nucleotide pyrophosphorylase (carboxylating)
VARRRPPPSARPAPLDRAALARALAEDRADGDLTSRALFPQRQPARARVVAQADGVLSGVTVATHLARLRGLRARALRADGSRLRPGTAVVAIEGDLRALLGVERTLLNYLMHLSGVATATERAVRRATRGGGPVLRIYATRKTLPGLRDLEKAAVRHGGGAPHRRDLASSVLIKTTHTRYLPLAAALARARRAVGRAGHVEVEVGSATHAVAAARAGADALLIDNRSPAAVRAIVRALRLAHLRDGVWVEVSGGIQPETVGRYRRVGADAVSLGSLTHSARALPFHLVVDPPHGGLARQRPR